jgi:Cu/Ag efflux pump CusA
VSLLPSLKQHDLLVQFEAAPGTSRPEMNRIMAQASSELQGVPGVDNIGFHVGRAITGDAVVGINSGEYWISIDPAADYDGTLVAIREVVSGYPGLDWAVRTYQPERLGQAVTGPDNDIVVRIYGHELDVLREKAREVVTAMDGIKGVVDAQAQLFTEEPQVEIEVDLAAAEQHGIKPGDVRRQATTLLSGIQVGSLFEEQKVFDVVVWGAPNLRSNLTNIRELLIDTPAGTQITLQEVADVRIVPAATVIERDAVSRYVDVGANVKGRSFSSVIADVENSVGGVQLPFEYHIEVLSDSQSLIGNSQRVLAVAVAALIGIFLLMQSMLLSWRLTIVLFLTLPMALAGGALAALIGGGELSIGSFFGFFAVLAITVRNSMVMLSRFQASSQRDVGGDAATIENSARQQLGPILTTVAATLAALLPLLVGGNGVGVEFVRPMAVVIVGGLITSALFNLFIVPAIYMRWPSPTSVQASPQPEARPSLDAV